VGLVESILVLSNTGLTLRGQSVLAMLVVSEKLRRRRILLTALATYLCFRSLSPHKLDSAVKQALRGKLGTKLGTNLITSRCVLGILAGGRFRDTQNWLLQRQMSG
jgi:hypothetical protein